MPPKIPKNTSPAVPVPATPAPALSLNLTSFADITTGKFCQLGKVDQTNPIPQISIGWGNPPTDPAVELYNANVGNNAASGGVRVKKMADLSFGLAVDPSIPGGPFAIIGLSIVPRNGGAVDNNISKAKWTPSAVSFNVRHGNKGGRWKFYVSILDTTSGVVGLIDPELENDVSARVPGS